MRLKMSSAKMLAILCRPQFDKCHNAGRKGYVRYLSIHGYFTVASCCLRNPVHAVIPLRSFQWQEFCRLIGCHFVAVNLSDSIVSPIIGGEMQPVLAITSTTKLI